MPLGIPHSVFLSWKDDDQDKALAFNRERRLHCVGCGTRQDEWDRDVFAYVAESVRCPGCELLEMERKNQRDGEMGIQSRLILRELATAPDEEEVGGE